MPARKTGLSFLLVLLPVFLVALSQQAQGQTPLLMSCNPATGPTMPNVVYTAVCPAMGGTPPYTWSISSGSLPTGLVLSASTGLIGGAPTVSGDYAYSVTVTDSAASPASFTVGFSGTISGSSGGPFIANPSSLVFTSVANVPPASQPVMLSGGSPGNTYITQAVSDANFWLAVSPLKGSVDKDGTLTISIQPAGLPQGIFNGSVSVLASDGTLLVIPVTLTVQAQLGLSPASLGFISRVKSNALPAPQMLSVNSTPPGVPFAAEASETWLQLDVTSGVTPAVLSVTVNPANLALDDYSGTITVSSAGLDPVVVPVALSVVSGAPPKLSVLPLTKTVSLTAADNPKAAQLMVANAGGGTVQYTAQAISDLAPWLSLSGPASGTATPSTPGTVVLMADPTGLPPGVYSGRVTVKDANSPDQAVVNVSMAVNPRPLLQVSLTGLTFDALANGPAPPAQTFTVRTLNGSVAWLVRPQILRNPLAPTANWLTVTQSFGPVATVSVNPSGLPPGEYYATLQIQADSTGNSPQSIVVKLNVTASNGKASIAFSANGLAFSASAMNLAPQPQTITLFNPSNNPVGFTTAASVAGTGVPSWLSVTPAQGILPPGRTALTIFANFSLLPVGLQTGKIAFTFDNGTSGTIAVNAISTVPPVITMDNPTIDNPASAPFGASCAGGGPGRLIPIFRKPMDGASLQLGAAQTIQVQVLDDCGLPVTAEKGGIVQAAGVDLMDVGAGVWEGTWTPAAPGTQVALQTIATEQGVTAGSGLAPGITVAVRATSASGQPLVSGVTNAALGAQAIQGVVTPGSYVAIYGNNLASGSGTAANTIPLPGNLNGTLAFLGDQPMPLVYAGAGQINALVPQSLPPNAVYPMVVQRDATRSTPVPLTITNLQPGIYTADLSGTGQGIVTIAGTNRLAAQPGGAAIAGQDTLVVFCTGLGPVAGPHGEPPPADGAAAPASMLFRTNASVTATLNGVSVPVLFAGLTPSLVGLYQINLQIPAGMAPGSAVPLVVNVADPVTGFIAQSNLVTVAIQ